MFRSIRSSTLLLICGATACAGDSKGTPSADTAASTVSAPVPAVAPNVVNVQAKDYSFEAPDTIPAGATTIRLTDEGKELHHVQLLKLTEGKTYEDLGKEMKGEPPMWAVPVGGPNSPIPGAASVSETSLQLEAGEYALVCFIPSPDGKPHLMKGMSRKLVVAASDAKGVLPEADLTVSLSDYSFTMPDSISAGRHVIKVENSAAQPHEIFIAKLADGKEPIDLVNWIEKMQGPPPATPFGGTSAFVKGLVNVVAVDLPPGNYGLFCFISDSKDGKPHVAHGMLRKLKVA